ncbi:MAG: recombinase family protein, partial [Ruminococcus sp.]
QVMGSNRKQPFGYKMEFGKVVENPVESHEVCCIFSAYQRGASFQELAETMREKEVPYDQDKTWNKNMIARILADTRYMGTNHSAGAILCCDGEKEQEKHAQPVYGSPKAAAAT